jgi:hypothetical protein
VALAGMLSAARAAGPPMLRITNGTLEVAYEADTGQFSVSRLAPERATFLRAGSLHGAGGTGGAAKVVPATDAVFGDGQAIEVAYPDGSRDEIRVFAGLPFVLFRSCLHNGDDEPSVTNKVHALSVGVDLGRPAEALSVLGTGGLAKAEESPGSYMWMAVADARSRSGVVAGWLTADRGSGIVFASEKEGRVLIDAEIDYGRLRMAPGQSEKLETFALGYFDDARLGLEAWADAVARVYGVKLPPQPCGYCTWYHAGASDEKALAAQSAFAAERLAPFGFSVVQIDDGWQDGDSRGNGPRKNFTRPRADGPYPSGMKATADGIRAAGLVPGVWFMPFASTYNDPWFESRQEWFVKRDDGRPFDVRWGGTCLDMTRPDVRDYVRDMVQRIARDWGYRYFKMDGLWTGTGTELMYVNDVYKDDGMGNAVFSNPEKTNIEAYRDGLKLVREAAGSDVFLLGCCANQNMRSYGGAFGLVDAMRIGPDNGVSWNGILTGARYGTRNYFLHGRVWYNDPDVIYVRPRFPVNEARVSGSWAAISGQLTIASYAFEALPPDRLDILKRIMPSHGLVARPVDLFEQPVARVWLLTDDRRQPRRDVVALFNWDDQPAAFDESLERMGLSGEAEYLGFDFWAGGLVPPVEKKLELTVPPHSCVILALRPVEDHPLVLSTSRHVTQGIVDVAEETWDAAARELSGISKVVGGDDYDLRVATFTTKGMWKPAGAEVSETDRGAGVTVSLVEETGLARVTIRSPGSREVSWKVRFEPGQTREPDPEAATELKGEMDDVFGPVTLSWKGNGPFYEVRRDNVVLCAGQSAASLVDSGTAPGNTYRYTVVPLSFDGRRGAAAELTFSTPTADPGPVPPLPQVSLTTLKPRSVRTGWGQFGVGKSAAGSPLTLGKEVFADGIGVHAPAEVVYDRKPEWKRFVAVVGIDEAIRKNDRSSLVCEVVAESGGRSTVLGRSPILRFGRLERWHFDVALPDDCERIHLVVTDGGDDNNSDHADWVRAGFQTE